MRLSIRRQYIFPMNYVVKVKQMDHDDFVAEHGDGLGVAFWEEMDGGGTIYLDKSRPLRKRLEDLIHEMDHVWPDFKEHLIDHVTKRKSR
jgi:hypothetical protein